MNKLVYLGLSTLEVSKILMYEFLYDYVKPKYKDIAEDVGTRFDTSNYELDHCLRKKCKSN